MKAVQTLWCGDRELEHSPFWWNDAECHLMSWALSAMTLRQYFDRLELYTDSQGAHVLIDLLGLPYTEVKVVYDHFHCLSCHWALSKVTTYSMQSEPFIHIDGDIYLPQLIDTVTLKSPLIVQNEEQCTDYYGSMVDRLLGVSGIKIVPEFRDAMEKKDYASYNLGFCGGTDIDFFGRFAESVFRFFRDNDFNSDRFRNDDISANVIFEQIFLAIMARREGIKPAVMLPEKIRDNGYLSEVFSDMIHFDRRPFIHILGGMKRRKDICRNVELTLLRLYPDVWRRVAALFPERHKLLSSGISTLVVSAPGSPRYEAALRDTVSSFAAISPEEAITEERGAAGNIACLGKSGDGRSELTLRLNPLMRILPIVEAERETVRARLCPKRRTAPLSVAVLPSVIGAGYVEIPLHTAELNIITLLSSPMAMASLIEALMRSFNSSASQDKAKKCAHRIIEYMLTAGAVIAKQKNAEAPYKQKEQCNKNFIV